MADSDQILQLGIEEARNGNREAARNLFELLTRQEPDNAQGWLWLAGVADGPDQRREALQRVIALEPENEMARKGLQAMGVNPSAEPVAAPVAAPAAPATSLRAEDASPKFAPPNGAASTEQPTTSIETISILSMELLLSRYEHPTEKRGAPAVKGNANFVTRQRRPKRFYASSVPASRSAVAAMGACRLSTRSRHFSCTPRRLS